MLVSLESLRAQARELADMENSGFVADTENGMDWRINSAGQELYGLVAEVGGSLHALQQNVAMLAGTESYALVSPAKAIHSVEYKDQPISPFGFSERGVAYGNRRYRLEGPQAIRFLPAPDSDGNHGRVWYFPEWKVLAAKTDTAELWDWSEYVTTITAIGLLVKEESDPSALMARKAELEARIRREAVRRDLRNGTPMVDAGGWDDCGWDGCGNGHERVPGGGY